MNGAIEHQFEGLDERVHEGLWRRVRMVRRHVDDDGVVDNGFGMIGSAHFEVDGLSAMIDSMS